MTPLGEDGAAPLQLFNAHGDIDAAALLAALSALRQGDFSVRIASQEGELSRRIAQEWNALAGNAARTRDTVAALSQAVGREGRLRERADVAGLSGGWAETVAAVNAMVERAWGPVDELARVINAVVDGNLSQHMSAEQSGDWRDLKQCVNAMVDHLAGCVSEVSRVAREVGREGRLGGRAVIENASGIWKDLADNVNGLADRLTTQVRAISEVATAVTRGDLSRAITVDARGEVAELKDRVNGMIWALRESARNNAEQSWLNTHLTRFTRLLQEQRDLSGLSRRILSELAQLVSARLGAFYISDDSTRETRLVMVAAYAAASMRPRRCPSCRARASSANAPSTCAGYCSPTCRPATWKSAPVSVRRRQPASSCCRC